jgi:hypothetical protein
MPRPQDAVALGMLILTDCRMPGILGATAKWNYSTPVPPIALPVLAV